MSEKRTRLVVWVAITVYIVVFSVFTSYRQYNFQTQTWDMGAFVQTFWNTTQGRVMQNNLEEASHHFGVHMSPWMFVLVPGYALFQSPYYLLIIQSIALGIGAWPLYLLARRILGDRRWAQVMALGYLLFPSLHWVNSYDFHSVSFFIPLMLAAFYYLEVEKWWWAGFFLVLAASTKENAILAVLFAGVWVLVRKVRRNGREKGDEGNGNRGNFLNQRRVFAIGIVVVTVVYFILTVKVFMPAFGGGLLRLDRYADFGETPREIVTTMVEQPMLIISAVFATEKLRYLLWLFLPVAFLPLFSGRALLLIIPGLVQNLLTSFSFQFASLYQYDSILLPGLWVATIYGLSVVLCRWPSRKRIIYWAVVVVLVGGYLFRSPLNPFFFPYQLFGTSPRWEAYREMVAFVPENVSVAAQTNLVPHLAHRERIYMLGREPVMTDMVLLDTQSGFGFPDTESYQAYVDQYLDSGLYSVRMINEQYLMLMRKE